MRGNPVLLLLLDGTQRPATGDGQSAAMKVADVGRRSHTGGDYLQHQTTAP